MKGPNFVVIYTDDHGYSDLGCCGSDDLKTPNLDGLAESGVRFTNWYSNSPVCSPSRASLLTGCYPQRVGVPHILGGIRGTPGLSPEHTTIARLLKSAGYRSGVFGKWHLGTTIEHGPNAHGFDEYFGFRSGAMDYYSHIYYSAIGGGNNPNHDLWENENEVWENGRYLTEMFTDKGVDFIRCSDEPFFLYVPFNAPHWPLHAPKEYVDRFPDLPPDRRIMAAMLAAVDDGVGAIIDALNEKGVYDDTVIFFSSDNGPSDESRNRLDGSKESYYGGEKGIFKGYKASLFDGGIHEPAIISWPNGIPGGRVCDEVVAMMDVVPTFLDIAGIEPEAKCDGASILPILTDNAPSPHDRIFWSYGDQLAVRQGRWKLVINGKLDFDRTQPDEVYLSDLDADPSEITNLKDQYPELVRELTSAIHEWMADVGIK